MILLRSIAVSTVALGVATVLVAPYQDELLTSYAGGSRLAWAADVAAGVSLLVAGVATLLVRRRGSLAAAALLAGAAWFAPDWVGWEGGSPLVRSLALVVAAFGPPLLYHVALATPDGRLSRPDARAVVGALYVVAAVVGLGLALFRDPFLDPHCWSNCGDNVFLVYPDQAIARVLATALPLGWLAGGIAVAALMARRLAAASGVARRSLRPVVIAAVILAAAQAAYALALLLEPAESPDDTVFAALFLARAGAVVLLAVVLGWSAYAVWRTRAAVARLATALGEAPAPGSLRAALAEGLGDPDVEVAYPLDGYTHFVDGAGGVVAPPVTTAERAVTRIMREGRCIAVVVHSRGVIVGDELARNIGAAARLAVENERLQAELLAQLRELRESRSRVVETGDAARRVLERNLHDGAQQRLLALVYDLRLTRSTAHSEGEGGLVAALDGALQEAEHALEELRKLAHGIYPAILTEAGLMPALSGLVDQAAIPVRLAASGAERYPAAVETAAYVVAGDAIGDAARRTATHAVLRLRHSGTRFVLEVEDDGAQTASVPLPLLDRVGAVGGRVERAGRVLRAELPCA